MHCVDVCEELNQSTVQGLIDQGLLYNIMLNLVKVSKVCKMLNLIKVLKMPNFIKIKI